MTYNEIHTLSNNQYTYIYIYICYILVCLKIKDTTGVLHSTGVSPRQMMTNQLIWNTKVSDKHGYFSW
jgi:hypothetical protein